MITFLKIVGAVVASIVVLFALFIFSDPIGAWFHAPATRGEVLGLAYIIALAFRGIEKRRENKFLHHIGKLWDSIRGLRKDHPLERDIANLHMDILKLKAKVDGMRLKTREKNSRNS